MPRALLVRILAALDALPVSPWDKDHNRIEALLLGMIRDAEKKERQEAVTRH